MMWSWLCAAAASLGLLWFTAVQPLRLLTAVEVAAAFGYSKCVCNGWVGGLACRCTVSTEVAAACKQQVFGMEHMQFFL
jgi:hypothetical protein